MLRPVVRVRQRRNDEGFRLFRINLITCPGSSPNCWRIASKVVRSSQAIWMTRSVCASSSFMLCLKIRFSVSIVQVTSVAVTTAFLAAVFDLIPNLRPFFSPNHWLLANAAGLLRQMFFLHWLFYLNSTTTVNPLAALSKVLVDRHCSGLTETGNLNTPMRKTASSLPRSKQQIPMALACGCDWSHWELGGKSFQSKPHALVRHLAFDPSQMPSCGSTRTTYPAEPEFDRCLKTRCD